MSRSRLWSRLGLMSLILVVLGMGPSQQWERRIGSVEISVRDSHRGYGLEAPVTVLEVAVPTEEVLPSRIDRLSATPVGRWLVPSAGRARFALVEGTYRFEARLSGYQPLRTSFHSQPGIRVRAVFWMVPEEPPQELRADVGQAERIGVHVSIRGHVVDSHTRRPLAAAWVRLERSGAMTQTNERGYFRLDVSTPVSSDSETDELVIESAGFETHRKADIPIGSSDVHSIIDMEPIADMSVAGRSWSTPVRLETPAPRAGPPLESLETSPAVDFSATSYPPFEAPFPHQDGVRLHRPLLVFNPPNTIRIGTSCDEGRFKCVGEVQVRTLEDYTLRGLDDEWGPGIFGGWDPQALRAGAIAYRSYGAHHVRNPACPAGKPQCTTEYDICNTDVCQQFDDTLELLSHRAPVQATAGIMLERDGNLARAEHSSENNNLANPDPTKCRNPDPDLTCGNGYAGSENQDLPEGVRFFNWWSCLRDEPCAARGGDESPYYCLGHGMGMCQQGTDRWAKGRKKLWNWIVDHYYNDNYNTFGDGTYLRRAFMTSPVRITRARVIRPRLRAGDSFWMLVNAANYAEVTHREMILTAALVSDASDIAGSTVVVDPTGDAKVTLTPRFRNTLRRRFTVHARTAPGAYDLVVALWTDTNGDGAVTEPPFRYGGYTSMEHYDQPLVSFTVKDAVEVLPGPEPMAISYFYSFGPASGAALVAPGETFTIWDEPGGCGPVFHDTAQCVTNIIREVRPYNHDCLSGENQGTLGPWVSKGCSEAEEFGYVVRCCVAP